MKGADANSTGAQRVELRRLGEGALGHHVHHGAHAAVELRDAVEVHRREVHGAQRAVVDARGLLARREVQRGLRRVGEGERAG